MSGWLVTVPRSRATAAQSATSAWPRATMAWVRVARLRTTSSRPATWARMAATSARRPGLARSRAWWPLLQRTNSSGKWRYWSRSQLACSLWPSVRNALPVVTVTRLSAQAVR